MEIQQQPTNYKKFESEIRNLHTKVQETSGKENTRPLILDESLVDQIPSESLIIFISQNYSLVHYNPKTDQILQEYQLPDELASGELVNLFIGTNQQKIFYFPPSESLNFWISNLDLTHFERCDYSHLEKIDPTEKCKYSAKFNPFLLNKNMIYFSLYKLTRGEEGRQFKTFVIQYSISSKTSRIIYSSELNKTMTRIWLFNHSKPENRNTLRAWILCSESKEGIYLNFAKKNILWKTPLSYKNFNGNQFYFRLKDYYESKSVTMNIVYRTEKFLVININLRMIVIDLKNKKMTVKKAEHVENLSNRGFILGVLKVENEKMAEIIKNLNPVKSVSFTCLTEVGDDKSLWVMSSKAVWNATKFFGQRYKNLDDISNHA